MDCSNYILANNSWMFLCKFFVANSGYHKLIFARFTAVDMIICVEKWPITDHKWHLIALMHNLKLTIHIHRCDLDLFVIFRQNFYRISEILDEGLRLNISDFNFADYQSWTSIVFPHLMLNEVVLLVSEHYRDFPFPLNELSCFI